MSKVTVVGAGNVGATWRQVHAAGARRRTARRTQGRTRFVGARLALRLRLVGNRARDPRGAFADTFVRFCIVMRTGHEHVGPSGFEVVTHRCSLSFPDDS